MGICVPNISKYMIYENPWTFDEQIFTQEFIGIYFGFVYCITNIISGKKYIGRKYFYTKINKKRKESDWEKYYGSSKNLLTDILLLGKENFKRKILSLHETRGDVNYWETKEQFNSNVLEAKDEFGNRLYYNDNIMSRYFVPKETFSQEHKRNLSLSHYGQIAWNKGLVGVMLGINTESKTEIHKKNLSNSLKKKGIKPKNCKDVKTKEHRKKISETLKITSNFVVENPRKQGNWIGVIKTENEILTIENPQMWLTDKNIKYEALKVWSRKNQNNTRLHPKYHMKIISLQTKISVS